MGVTGLWRLIEPAGKPVPVETLENKVLAVDISIWLHQMVKGYQDAKGAPLPNAHLMGLFQRLCKLLYFRIKPVFVFDGAFPELKKETIAKRQDTKSKYNSESEQLKRQLALLLSKKTAVSSLLGKQNVSPKKQQTVADTSVDDIFKLPELPQKEENESESEEESSSGSIVDLHSVDVESENFKNLPVKEKYDLLVELKETRKMNSWGRLHELPKQSDNFSDFQLQRLLKRRKVQECLEETEKEIGGAGMSLNDLETLLNEEGISTKIDSLPSRRIASNDSTRFILLKNVKQALADAKSKKEAETKAKLSTIEEPSKSKPPENVKPNVDRVEQENKKDELKDDLEKAIKMSLECHTTDDPNTSANTSKTDGSWTSILSDNDYSDIDSEENNGDYEMPDMSSAKAYIMQYSDFTSKAINKLVAPKPAGAKHISTIPTADKIIEELYQEKSMIVDTEKTEILDHFEKAISFAGHSVSEYVDSSENNVISLDSSIEETIKVSEPRPEKNVPEELSDSSDDEFEEVSVLEESSIKLGIEIALPLDMPLDPEEDIFADVFADAKTVQPLTEQHIKQENKTSENDAKSENINLEFKKIVDRQKVKHEVLAKLEEAKKDLENLLKNVGDKNYANTTKDIKANVALKHSELDPVSEVGTTLSNKLDSVFSIDQSTETVKDGLNIKKELQNIKTNTMESSHESNEKQIQENTCIVNNTYNQDKNNDSQDTYKDNQDTTKDLQNTSKDDQDTSNNKEDINKYNQEREKVISPILSTETLNSMAQELQNQEDNLLEEKGRLDRMGRNITEQMRKDAQELLQIFGIPYIVAPMEAEAQCAFLEAANLTDGTITDDSDIWLFGGRTVYKNFFNQKKHVLQYLSERIEKSFNLTREKLILLALLVGSDYTTGVDGVGPVTALEILASFPYNRSRSLASDLTKHECYQIIVEGLKEFKKWVKAGKRTDNVNLKKKLRNICLSEDFPSIRVVQAYMEPNIEKSEERFSWGDLDVTVLRDYTKSKFGWSQNKLDEIIKPVLKRRQEGKVQRSVRDYFKRKIEFQSVEDQVSKRVKAAIQRMGPDGHLIDVIEQPVESKKPKVQRKRRASKKTNNEESNLEKAGPSLSKISKNEDILPISNIITKVETERSPAPDLVKIEVSKTDRCQEIIPQREKDRQSILQNRMKAIEVFRKTKIEKKKKTTKRKVNLPKEKAELSESSDSN